VRAFVNVANVVTSLSLTAGVLAIMLAADGRLAAALAAVAVAAVLDSVDGYLARRSRTCGAFGCQLDSLADLVAFGVAPALLLQQGPLDAMPGVGQAACVAFVVAGAWRLSRFAVLEDPYRFTGLPIPPAGLIVSATAVLALPGGIALAVALILVVLMVSAIPVPTLVALADLVRGRPRVTLRLVGGDHALHRPRARKRARAGRDQDERADQGHDEERVRAPALARE
jgi:CDP-diacylglycerol---serine O-phosphatidyltransferase